MEAQKCKLCGSQHTNREPHKWNKAADAEIEAQVHRVPARGRGKCLDCAAKDEQIADQAATIEGLRNQLLGVVRNQIATTPAVTNGCATGKRDRAAYYRKRRADKKAAKEARP